MFGVKEHTTGKGLHAGFSHGRRFDQNFYNVPNFIKKNCGYLVHLCLPSERLCTEHAEIRDETVHDGYSHMPYLSIIGGSGSVQTPPNFHFWSDWKQNV